MNSMCVVVGFLVSQLIFQWSHQKSDCDAGVSWSADAGRVDGVIIALRGQSLDSKTSVNLLSKLFLQPSPLSVVSF